MIFTGFGLFEVFRAFFQHVLKYQFEIWYIHAVGGITRQEIKINSSNLVHRWPAVYFST